MYVVILDGIGYGPFETGKDAIERTIRNGHMPPFKVIQILPEWMMPEKEGSAGDL